MELFLNLLWLSIAACAVLFWRTHGLREGPQSGRELLRESTAMCCALVLLFFAVSLTDDLHAEAMLLDECSTVCRHYISGCHSQEPGRTVRVSFPAILPKVAVLQSRLIDLREVSVSSYFSSAFLHDLSEGRAPPITIL